MSSRITKFRAFLAGSYWLAVLEILGVGYPVTDYRESVITIKQMFVARL
jgi:hypothetical protein